MCRNFFLQINMFLTKLTATPIGLTACDMFVIDKPSVLLVSKASQCNSASIGVVYQLTVTE
jgi:hypothetical protein